MFNQIKKISAAAAIMVALPALASAQTVAYSTAPVSINSCDNAPSTVRFVPLGYGSIVQSTSAVAVDYVNTGSVPATAITFVLKSGNTTQNVVAKGSFAPGVNIARTFETNDTGNAQSACTVAEVRFADGQVWEAAPSVVSSR